MPDVSLNGIEFEIKGSTDAASSSIDNLIGKLGALNTALSQVADIKKLATGLNSLKKAIDNLNSADLDKIKASLESFGQVSESLSGLSSMSKDLASFMRALAKLAESPENVLDLAQALNILGSADLTNLKDAEGAMRALADALSSAGKKNTVAKAMRDVGREAKKANTPLSNFLASIKRIAFYRILRGILKSISQGFQEGLKNAYQFSKLNGGDLAASLDLIATKSLTMKNQLGAAFGALLNAIAPVIVAIISLVTRLANALSMLFSAIGGGTQYKKAKDAWTDWGDAAAGAGGAAKEALRYLAPFDELNRLPDDNGGGGSAIDPDDMFEYKDLPEWLQNFASKLQELAASLKITFNDVFFDWSDLTGEQIAEKAITGLGALLGAGVGFLIGGVPGAVVGTLVGMTVGLMVSSLIFDHDGTISKSEIANMVSLGLSALCGGVLGFIAGGPGCALLGATVGIGLWGALKGAEFFSDGNVGNLTSQLATALTALTGAVVGFKVGGPGGALIGATVGLGLTMAIGAITFDGESHPGYESGLDWFVIEVLGLPSDQELKDWGKNAVEWFRDGIEGETFDDWAANLGAKVDEALQSEADKLNFAVQVGIELAKEGWTTVKGWFSGLGENATTAWGEIKTWLSKSKGTSYAWSSVQTWFNGLGEKVSKGWSEIRTWLSKAKGTSSAWSSVQTWFNGLGEKVNKGWGEIRTWLSKGRGTDSAWSSVQSWFNGLGESVNSAWAEIKTRLTKTWTTVTEWIQKFVKGTVTQDVDLGKNAWTTVTAWVNAAAQKGTTAVSVAVALAKSGWESVSAWVSSLLGGGLKLNVTKAALGGAYYGGSWHSIPQYASGGKVHGSMFIAGEAGPEIVGHVGGRTEVLNQSQLAATMYAAVSSAMSGLRIAVSAPSASAFGGDNGMDEETMYRAFSRALADSDLGGDIELDGEAIYRSVVRRNRQNTRATGVNQFAMA